MRVLFFAQSRGATRCQEARIEVEGPIDANEFWDRLIAQFSALGPLRRTARLARNDSYLGPDELLRPNDEIAVLPPVSGG